MNATRATTAEVRGDLGVYLGQIPKLDLLSAEDERSLAIRIARGDSDARTWMIQANLRLVVPIAREFAGRGMSLDDLVGEGNIGLIRAAEAFDPSFGARFSTYAAYWIRQAIRRALTDTSTTIRLPSHMVVLLAKWRRAERALNRELGRPPGRDEVADRMELTPARRMMIDRALSVVGLRPEGGDGEATGGWAADAASDHREPPDAALEHHDERLDLLRRLDRLDVRERAIVTLRFGLDGDDPLTLRQIGERLGVTREWVRKIEARALHKLDARPAAVLADDPRPRPQPRRRVSCPRRAQSA